MKELFEIYSSSAVTKTVDSHNKLQAELQAIRYIKNVTEMNLLDSAKLIENTNPYDNKIGYILRTDYEYLINKRRNLKNESKVENTFGFIRSDGSKGNSAETMIQRHIMLAEGKYDDVLGKPIFFEFVPNKEEKGEKKIDLITYNKKENTLNLIEIKKCSYIRNQKMHSYTRGQSRGDSSDSHEMFIRAAFEISTYYSFFIHALKNEEVKEKIKKALESVGELEIDLDNVKIRKGILAPFSFYFCENEEIEDLKKHYDCYMIQLNDEYDDLRNYPVNSQEQLFKIEKINEYN